MTKPDLRSYHAADEHNAAADAAYAAVPHNRLSLRQSIVVWTLALLHPLGFHHWTRWLEYSPGSDSFVDVGVICRNCPRALYR